MRVSPFKKSGMPAFRAMMRESSSEFGKAWARHISLVFSHGARWQNAENYAVLDQGSLSAVFSLRREVEALVIYFILIKKSEQGRGIGTAIVRFAEKKAAASNSKFLRLDAYSGKKAIGFYRKLGFKVGGRVRYYEEENDNQVFLYKKL